MKFVSPFVGVKTSIVVGAKKMMKVLMVNDRLDEKPRYGRCVQGRMYAHLGTSMVVGPQPDTAPALPAYLLAPTNRQFATARKVFQPYLRTQQSQVMRRGHLLKINHPRLFGQTPYPRLEEWLRRNCLR